VFAIASAVLAAQWSSLTHTGHEWWLWVGITGTVLGIIGTLYVWRRRARRTRSESGPD